MNSVSKKAVDLLQVRFETERSMSNSASLMEIVISLSRKTSEYSQGFLKDFVQMEKFKGTDVVQSLKEIIDSKQSLYRPAIHKGIMEDIENLMKLLSPHDNIEEDVPSLNDESHTNNSNTAPSSNDV